MNPTGEIRWRGGIASRGLALGAARVERPQARRDRRAGTPGQERARLEQAIQRAGAALQALLADQDEVAGAILEFQVALLEDEELAGPAFAAIDRGEAAEPAWRAALDSQIRDYEGAEDDYFRARASDLADLRERVLSELAGAPQATQAPRQTQTPIYLAPIYLGPDLTPSRFLELDWTRYAGAALTGGSATSHVAILARARGVPMLINLEADLDAVPEGAEAILDAEEGWLVLDPAPSTRRRFEAAAAARASQAERDRDYLTPPAVTATGRRIGAQINVDDPSILDGLEAAHCDGIGLARTEFLFQGRALPDEETQVRVYARLLDWAAGRPVTIRTLDAGGDKPVAGLTPEAETNPFLGVRGLRLSLCHPETFAVQLRALARAAALGPLKVMCPMVTTPAEMAAARGLLEQAVADLKAAGKPCAMPPLGMMVEVPAAALRPRAFEVDFYSIGSNDLVQYVTATARDNPALAELHDPANPAVLELIGRTVEAGRALGREVSLCGDMAAEPDLLPPLLGLGLEAVSVAPAALARVKAAIARWHG